MTLAGKQRVAHDTVPVGLCASVEEEGDGVISLAEEGGEEEDEQAEGSAAECEFSVRLVLELGEDILTKRHRAYEIKTHQSAEHTKKDVGRDTTHWPIAIDMEDEQRGGTAEHIGETGGGDTRDEYGQE